MRVRPWAVAGSVLVNLVLAALVATAVSVAASVQAAESVRCASQRTALPARPPERQPATSHRGYVVAVRMGWASG